MKYLRRILGWIVAVASGNVVWLVGGTALPLPAKIGVALVGVAGYVFVHARPRKPSAPPVPAKTNTMLAGYELLLAAGVSALADIAGWIWLGVQLGAGADAALWVVFAANAIVGAAFVAGLAVNGFIRVAVGSTQVPLTTKVLLALLWWFPPATAVLFRRMARTINQEALVAPQRAARDQARLEAQVCRTKYPVLLVHGAFFRDWQAFNYWGRIPAALEANGAVLHYAGQQASASVAVAGAEVAQAIRRVVEQTGCGKVNIIAHSKGGLDSRWAISQLGMADHVASLTTVNTPHHGCNFARKLMETIPQEAVNFIGEKYDVMFTKLGDPDPDFLAAIAHLTDTACAELNTLMPDAPGVYYQSVTSRMASRFAAPFPLSLGYSLIQPLEGDNDGLVAVRSAAWGNFLGVVEPTGKHGLSHGDMIDLLRRDIDGFDVCEFYVGLVACLYRKGF